MEDRLRMAPAVVGRRDVGRLLQQVQAAADAAGEIDWQSLHDRGDGVAGQGGHVYAGGVTLVWVTGNSGTGKSTVCGLLRERGYVALDADEDGFSRWIDRASGKAVMDPPYPVPGGWLDRYGWAIVRERVETLVEESRFRIAFLCGSAENEADVLDLFDCIVCLVIDEDTLRHRLATRTTNAFGQHPEELAAALKWNPRMRAIYESRGATIIDASTPVTEVVDSVIDAVQELRGGA